MADRFKDTEETIYSFTNNISVRCPRCAKRALVSRPDFDPENPFRLTIARVICEHCAYAREQKPEKMTIGAPVDCFFNLPLWLQIGCCGEILWAYNEPHLSLVENFVRADLREDSRATVKPAYYWHNVSSLSMKLPTWLKLAKNRDEILKAIERLRKTLE
jgi:hypothetical protein